MVVLKKRLGRAAHSVLRNEGALRVVPLVHLALVFPAGATVLRPSRAPWPVRLTPLLILELADEGIQGALDHDRELTAHVAHQIARVLELFPQACACREVHAEALLGKRLDPRPRLGRRAVQAQTALLAFRRQRLHTIRHVRLWEPASQNLANARFRLSCGFLQELLMAFRRQSRREERQTRQMQPAIGQHLEHQWVPVRCARSGDGAMRGALAHPEAAYAEVEHRRVAAKQMQLARFDHREVRQQECRRFSPLAVGGQCAGLETAVRKLRQCGNQ